MEKKTVKIQQAKAILTKFKPATKVTGVAAGQWVKDPTTGHWRFIRQSCSSRSPAKKIKHIDLDANADESCYESADENSFDEGD